MAARAAPWESGGIQVRGTMERGSTRVRGSTDARLQRRAAAYPNAAPRMSGNIRVRGSMRERGSTGARHHTCAATQLRGSIHERGTIANIDVNEAATKETIRVAAIHKKIIYVCNGWHGRYNRGWNLKQGKCIIASEGMDAPA